MEPSGSNLFGAKAPIWNSLTFSVLEEIIDLILKKIYVMFLRQYVTVYEEQICTSAMSRRRVPTGKLSVVRTASLSVPESSPGLARSEGPHSAVQCSLQ